jgi:pSer/pThr/pTyr-binding forkhead associated (FHA) protein/ribosomal protein L40E
MLICPNCNHTNPEGATQCEACYTLLPQMIHCPHCNAPIQTDATFCGSCGNSVTAQAPVSSPESSVAIEAESPNISPEIPSIAENPVSAIATPPVMGATQLQVQSASLLHLQTQTQLDFPQGLAVIHIGKPNEQIPPDIDVSGFPNSDIVSRIHADIRLEGDTYYIEDVGSANGTYINHGTLIKGNRHRLRAGDRISLGKGDLMTFIFQLT